MHDHSRRLVAGSLLLAGVLAAAGCSAHASAQSVPAPTPSGAAPTLAQAATRLGTETARFTVTLGAAERATGVIDPATGNWEMTGDGYVVRRIGPAVYVRLTAEPAHSMYPGQYADDLGRWVHTTVPTDAAPAFAEGFPWAAARTLAGQPGAAPGASGRFRLGGGTAELDVAGRFSRITLTDPAMTVSYADYGLPVRVTAPPADQVAEDHLFTVANLGPIF
ncbi:hypothetical protein ACWT_3047 [Actinoplanes sp. SE50]|uniref:hypothetical protein n=1 Tax=unclassified Actinoplanes TaxID=2626549 RepID=UPI00023EC0CD|nr:MULTISPECIES: hypothetical protein [unclassified Actinoplanes]AEV84070.1 hypothetical protein ACPL_3175 [Actinoplanes sp. SE50/110]ATO82462.1 hypothetical protein ACWT_3047 [Actinoplanes sp. SE50]SLL99869.1 hypothetical protein ACSP50_3101 [Actinoplanes sp. SE50/110]